MPNKTSQVQHKYGSKKLIGLTPKQRLALEKEVGEQLEAEGYPVFLKAQTARRNYPGEAEALHLVLELEDSPHSEREALLKMLGILRTYEDASNSGNNRELAKAARARKAVVAKLQRSILSGRNFTLGVSRQGLLVQPYSNKGMTAFALLSLFEQRRLSRIRRCLHCRSWFFARFKHQRFCPFGLTKCQWNHYHTLEWRRQHREQNKKHQRAYRGRIFGNRRPRP